MRKINSFGEKTNLMHMIFIFVCFQIFFFFLNDQKLMRWYGLLDLFVFFYLEFEIFLTYLIRGSGVENPSIWTMGSRLKIGL